MTEYAEKGDSSAKIGETEQVQVRILVCFNVSNGMSQKHPVWRTDRHFKRMAHSAVMILNWFRHFFISFALLVCTMHNVILSRRLRAMSLLSSMLRLFTTMLRYIKKNYKDNDNDIMMKIMKTILMMTIVMIIIDD